jgi:hypothetical protein
MEKKHFGQHGDDCFGCRIQTIQISPYATPSRLRPHIAPRKPENSWEKGVPTDSRGMPFLKTDGSPMGQKEFSEKRRLIDAHRRRLHNEPAKPTGSN